MPTIKSSASDKTITLDNSKPTFFVQTREGLGVSNESSKDSFGSLYYAKRETILVVGSTKRILINGCLVSLFKIIREGDVIRFGEEDWNFYEIKKEILDANSIIVKKKKQCLVCRNQFKSKEIVVYCPSCNTPHHENCWIDQKGRCANGKACDYQAPWAEDKA